VTDELINTENLRYFDFKCPYCQSQDIEMRSLKHEYKPDETNNEDLKLISIFEAERLDRVFTLGSTIVNSDRTELICRCNKCNIGFRIDDELQKKDLRKWVKIKYGGDVECL